jgi:iron complex outermembrane receptor protein
VNRGALFLIRILFVTGLNLLFYIASGQIIKGRVTDEKGNPLAGAAVKIENSIQGTYTGPDGTYTFRISKNGTYNLKFSFLGYENVTKQVILADVLTLDVTLVPGEIMTQEVIVNGTRAGHKTPVTFMNIGKEDIAVRNNGQDIPFLIGTTPSIVETSETGTGIGYTGLRIRGTDGSRINVTVDGIPLNDAESQQVFWVDLPDLAASVDNIQIQRGVGTSTNGSGAFGASVNIETKAPEYHPFAQVDATMGSFNTLKNMIMAGTGLIKEKFALQMRYSDIRSSGYIERTGVSNRSAYISAIYLAGKSRFRANLVLGEEHTGISWWGVPKEMLSVNRRYNPAGEYTDENGITQYYSNESDNYRQNHFQLIYSLDISQYTFLHAAFHYTFGEGYYEEYREDQAYTDYGLDPVVIGGEVINTTDLIRRKWMRNDFYGIVYSLKYKKERVDAVVGGGANYYLGDHFGRIIWMRSAGNTEKDHQWYLNNAEKGEFSIYGKLNYKISDKINGFGDLNWRYISYRMKGPDDDLKELSLNKTFSFLNPKAGIFYTISPRQDAYISFSVAHKEPTRSDYKEASGDESATPQPEALFNAETGYNLTGDKASAGINLYGMFYRDQLVPTGELSNVGYPIMTNVKKSFREGVELSAGFKPVRIIDWKFNLTLSRNRIIDFTEYYQDYITATDSYEYKSKKLGNVDIAYSPGLITTGDLGLILSDKLKIHLITKYVGNQYFDNTMNSGRMLDPYLVNNMRIDYSPSVKNIDKIDIQLFMNNVFNNKYENNAYGGNWFVDGIENTWSYYFPQAGINFLLRLGITF